MKNKDDKRKDLEALKKDLAANTNIFVTGYEKMTVAQDNVLRRTVREAGGSYKVVKNNLAAKASEGTAAAKLLGELKGMTSLAFAPKDPVALAKALVKYAKADEAPAIAITDTNNLFGALEFSEKAAKAGVQPLIGAQLTVDFDDAPAGGFSRMAERAMEQVSDEQLFAAIDKEANSIAVIVKHMAGNMLSRWIDFLTSDGEKPDRCRDTEFEDPPATREAVLAMWEGGWCCLFSALEPLTDADLARTVTIRGEEHSVMQAINRQLAHYPYHCGQIVLLAKHFNHDAWQSLSVPRKKSAEFNRKVGAGEASQR